MSQAAASQQLIEERVETGLREMLDAYQPGYTPGGGQRDELNGRFSINIKAPLAHLSTSYATAYEASDTNNPNRQIYALVMKRSVNYRSQAMDALEGNQHPHMLTLLAQGTVFLSGFNESFHVVVLDKPAGISLAQFVQRQRISQEHAIRDAILSPICKALIALREKQIVHGCLNSDRIFIGEVLQIGECISSPLGFDQHYLFEPLERMMSDIPGKGTGSEKIDVYAAGVLSYELLYGLDHLKRMPKEQFIEQALDLGTYNMFANNLDFPDGMQDFFRGILNDNPAERWGIDQLHQWLNGKRFNMLSMSSSHESVRPIAFDETEFYSQRALAHRMHKRWREAIKDVRALKLDRWAEMSLHKPEIGENVSRVIRLAGAETSASERQNNEMLTRIIAILDPHGPIRSRLLSVRTEGIGTMLAYCIEQGMNTELQHLLELLESDMPNFLSELNEDAKTQELSQLIWRLQRVRTHIKMRSLGFGLERVLYDLNPNMPCQSPLVLQYHITNTHDLLRTLDSLAKKLAANTPLLDRHIAAFVASRLDMGKEIKLHELNAMPHLANDQELVMMRILAKAQTKSSKLLLPGLCGWAAMRVELMLDHVHNRSLRKKLKLELKPAATAGFLSDISEVIASREIANRDTQGFSHAIALYQVNKERIEKLNNPRVIEVMSKDLGGRIAALLSNIVLMVTCYFTLSDFMGW